MKNIIFAISFVFAMLATMYSVHSKSVYNNDTYDCTLGDVYCGSSIDHQFCNNNVSGKIEAIVCNGTRLNNDSVFADICDFGGGCGQYLSGLGRCINGDKCEEVCKNRLNFVLSKYRDILAIRNRKNGELLAKSKGWPAGCPLDSFVLTLNEYIHY